MSISHGRVFVVEDEDLISMLTEDMLSDLGYEVTETAASPRSGLDVAAGDAVDVAVLDIDLNGTPSYPIAGLLLYRGIPFVLVSGYATGGRTPDLRSPRAPEPFTSARLPEVLAKALDRWSAYIEMMRHWPCGGASARNL